MALTSYQIGTATTEMSYVEDLLTNTVSYGLAPRGMAVHPYSYYHEASSGREYGDGYPYTQWEFDGLGASDKAALDAYLSTNQSAQLYIRTRKEDGSYALYQAIMHRPKQKDEGRYESGIWQSVIYRFTMLIEQEEEEE